jgi:hypothetical protein
MKLAPIVNPDVRKPSPQPVRVDLRKVFLIGTALWLIATLVCCVLMVLGISAARVLVICVAGDVVGVLLLLWERFDRWDYRRLGE